MPRQFLSHNSSICSHIVLWSELCRFKKEKAKINLSIYKRKKLYLRINLTQLCIVV